MTVEVRDLGWNALRQRIKLLDEHVVDVGIQAGEDDAEGTDLLDIAIYNEFGTETIPSRPFMRQTANENRQKAGEVGERYYQMILTGQMTPFKALRGIGQWYEGVNRKSLRETPWTPNAPATIAKKRLRSDKPLVDKGRLVSTIRSEVRQR
jgi:hypothetical protein